MAAAIYLLISVLTWSFLPLSGAMVMEKINQWDFMLWTQCISLASTWFFLRVGASMTKVSYLRLKDLNFRMHCEFAFSGLTYIISLACMWKSYSYVSKAGATVVYEIWPILSMFLTPIFVKKAWSKLPLRDFIFAALAFIGAGFILVPELKDPFFQEQPSLLKACMILLLPFFGGVFMALSSVSKTRLTHHLGDQQKTVVSKLAVQSCCMFYALIFIGMFVGVMHMAGLADTHNDVYDVQSIGMLLIVGIVIYTLGSLTYVIGLLKSDKSNIMVLWYFMPILSVIWLLIAGAAVVTPHLIIGASSIICANLLVTIRVEERISYSATILSLLIVGVLCFFMDGFKMEDYYQAMSVPLTFYAIIVAFLMDRIIRRDTFEEGLALEVIKHIQIEMEKPHGVEERHLIESVISMVQTNDIAQIAARYAYLRNDLSGMRQVQEKLDALVLSRAEGVNFSELLVLSLIGLLTISMTVFYRPVAFVADCFAVILTTAIAFIFFMVVDLIKKRQVFNLKMDDNGRFVLCNDTMKDTSGEVVIATIMIIAVIVAFIFLMWLKHQGFQ